MSIDQGTGAPSEGGRTRLTLPATARYARVARLTIAGLASRSGYGYDDVEDIRIAIGEVFSLLIATEGDEGVEGRITLSCTLDDHALDLEAERRPVTSPLVVDDLSRQILEAVTDETTIDEAAASIHVRKRPRP